MENSKEKKRSYEEYTRTQVTRRFNKLEAHRDEAMALFRFNKLEAHRDEATALFNNKRFKKTSPSLSKEEAKFSSPSKSEISEVVNETTSSPPSTSKPHKSLPSQGSINSDGSSSTPPATSLPFSAGFDDITDVVRRLSEHPTNKEAFDIVRKKLEPVLPNHIKQLSENEATFEVGLQVAACILKLLGSPNREPEIVGDTTSKGDMPNSNNK